MALFSKPTKIPRWADTGTIVEPSEAKKDSGWVAPELPPDTFFNWHQNLVGLWNKWFDERHDDGATDDDYVTHAPDPAAGAAGKGTFRGGDSADSTGGDGEFLGGESIGTDLSAGDAVLGGGDGTGTGSSKAKLQASTAGSTGSTPNVKEDYVVADGATGLVDFLKGIINSSPLATTVIASSLKSTDAEAYKGERNTSGTASIESTVTAKLKTSGNMSDGFGPRISFEIEDDVSGSAVIAGMSGKRDGADDSGELVLGSVSSGSFSDHARLRASGLMEFLSGLRGDGVSANQNGSGVIGRGLVASGALGTAPTDPGAGVVGVGSELSGGATTGYGGISQAAATTPTRAAHLFVPMAVAPTAGEAGALYPQESVSTSHAKLQHHNGAEFERLVPQVFSGISEEVLVGGVGAIWSDNYVIPANTLRVGSVIRVFATGATVGVADGGNVDYSIRLNDGTPLAGVGTSVIAIASSGQWVIEGRWTIKTIGVSGETLFGGVGSHGPEATPEVKSRSGASGTTLSTTVAVTIEAVVVFSVATSGNTARMDQFIVEVT